MNTRLVSLAVVTTLLAACSEPQPPTVEQAFIEDVATALGGETAIVSTDTLAMEAEGRMLNLGQDLTPEAATMEFDISGYKLAADLDQERSRIEMTRTPLFDYFRGRDPMYQAYGIDGNLAYDLGADGSARRAHDDVATDRRATFYHHPLPLLHAVLTESATASNVRREDGLELVDISTRDGKVYTLATDANTHLPAYISSIDHHAYLRDITRKTDFAEYAQAGELRLPTEIGQSLDEFHWYRLHVLAQEPNAELGDLRAPRQAAEAAPVSGIAPITVATTELGAGVWFMTGQSHHSVLFEFSDHLMLLEAPNEARTLAIIEASRQMVPDKPLTKLINTHHHFDHSGGVRTAVANGLTVITHAANEAFYRRMAAQPSTLVPDALAKNPQAIDIEVVDEQRVYADDSMAIEVYHVAGSPHSDSMLMVYVPALKLLVEADLYNPGRSTPQLFAPNLLANIQRLGLDVEKIVPIHGDVVDFAELETAVESLRN